MNAKEVIENLRQALAVSPDNVPLRKYLAGMLLEGAEWEEAETEYKTALGFAPDDQTLKLGLAQAFFGLRKLDAASVVVEELLSLGNKAAALYLLHARLLFVNGTHREAYNQYKAAIKSNPQLADKAFEEQLNEAIARSGKAGRVSAPVDDELLNYIEKEFEKPKVRFKDVGGMDQVKEEIALKVIYPLKNPEIYKAYGKKAGGGILLYGPPGCGKTHLARATAGEIEANFISVGISDVLDMWVGNSEKNLHQIFEQARQLQPCVLFFDEVDALGASRTDMRRSEGRFLINQFLNELDGIDASNEGVLILAATNSPWYLDAAFRRPGRFGRIIFVAPPDQPARVSILQLLLKDTPTEKTDYEALAKMTSEFSGADLKAIVDMAIEGKITESLKAGRPLPLTQSDLKAACGRQTATTREWFSAAKNYALYANEGGLYDDILRYLKIKK